MRLQVRETDINTLEKVVGIVAFGDIEAEEARNLTELNFTRMLRLSQLATEYLLHVQDQLAYDNGRLKVRLRLLGSSHAGVAWYAAAGLSKTGFLGCSCACVGAAWHLGMLGCLLHVQDQLALDTGCLKVRLRLRLLLLCSNHAGVAC